ncbi:hypothetical protein [Subtercola vilae]|uniref:hypothetical protein n=1 Tax=Subtercola vilae TaxID=2056433 RepID=UPI001376345E|nr:hypothetical protein [Subtercola vilae]
MARPTPEPPDAPRPPHRRTPPGPPDEFDPPLPLPSGRRTAFAVTIAAWGVLVVSVPLYAAFLLYNLPDTVTMVSALRASLLRRR